MKMIYVVVSVSIDKLFLSVDNEHACILYALTFFIIEPVNLPKLVVAFKSTIKTMRFNSIGTEVFESITLPQLKSITAIVYNPINNTIILSDTGAKKIFEYSFSKKRLTVLIDQHLDSVKGMDIGMT